MFKFSIQNSCSIFPIILLLISSNLSSCYQSNSNEFDIYQQNLNQYKFNIRKLSPCDASNQYLKFTQDDKVCFIDKFQNPKEQTCWGAGQESVTTTTINPATQQTVSGKHFNCKVNLVNHRYMYQSPESELICDQEFQKIIDNANQKKLNDSIDSQIEKLVEYNDSKLSLLDLNSDIIQKNIPQSHLQSYPNKLFQSDSLNIVAGYFHLCLYSEQTLSSWNIECYGDNDENQLQIPVEIQNEPQSILNMTAGPYNTCVNLNNGILQCWGKESNNINQVPSEFSKTEQKQYNYEVSISENFACGIKFNKIMSLYHLQCWGICDFNTSQSDQGKANTSHQSTSQLPKCTVPTHMVTQTNYVSTGFDHVCGILDSSFLNQHLSCFGNNHFGQTSVPSSFHSHTMLVSAGHFSTCAIRANFKLRCWGISQYVPPTLLNQVNSVSAGGRHTCSMQSGKVNCWGNDQQGQTSVPVEVKEDAWSIRAGWDFNCAINLDSAILCQGFNQQGQTEVKDKIPVRNNGTELKASQISVGLMHSCALLHKQVFYSHVNSTLSNFTTVSMPVCWGGSGRHDFGQTSVPANFRFHVADVNAGDEHTCAGRALSSNFRPGMRVVECWGSNEQGQSNVPDKLQQQDKLGRSSDIQISAGGTHSCALNGVSESSELTCWGGNSHGQTSKPGYYSTNVSQVSAGTTQTCIIWKGLGVGHIVRCWGEGISINRHNVLGNRLVNPQILSTNWSHSCTSNGAEPLCWGDDDWGQSSPNQQRSDEDDYENQGLKQEGIMNVNRM